MVSGPGANGLWILQATGVTDVTSFSFLIKKGYILFVEQCRLGRKVIALYTWGTCKGSHVATNGKVTRGQEDFLPKIPSDTQIGKCHGRPNPSFAFYTRPRKKKEEEFWVTIEPLNANGMGLGESESNDECLKIFVWESEDNDGRGDNDDCLKDS
ncbi:uncharacterized protein G2W53_041003 [Senna tora]|uniref:Uncharacterized protein n=1 Tax=Senna tora TaxID=362788 RepID=A0A834VYD2_9FABA|nr:uncharacterized protein G2W53_041003 [Senna tora]